MMNAVIIATAGMLVLGTVDVAWANGPIPPAAPPAPTALPPPPTAVAPAPPPAFFLGPAIPAPVYNWSGIYVGGNLGGGWASRDATITRTVTIDGAAPVTGVRHSSSSGSGIIGGGQVGFNFQVPAQQCFAGTAGAWVLGVEAEIDGADIGDSSSGCVTGPSGGIIACPNLHNTLDDFGTVRGRLGYAFNNLLVYGTGGWAWADNTTTGTITCIGGGCPATSLAASTPSFKFQSNPDGWAAGGGIEWGFLPNWSLR